MWKLGENAQFPQSFGRLVPNTTETVHLHKFSHQEIRWNVGILRNEECQHIVTSRLYSILLELGYLQRPHLSWLFFNLFYYLYDFVVRDINIVVYLESPRKIKFILMSEPWVKIPKTLEGCNYCPIYFLDVNKILYLFYQ